MLGGHIQPQLGALLAVERRGDALLHVASRRTHRGQTSDAAGTQRAMQTQVDCASSLRAAGICRIRMLGCTLDYQFMHVHKRHLIDSVCNYVEVTLVVWDEITVV